jgi:hypothetical protein
MKVRPIADKNDEEFKACNISTQIILSMKWNEMKGGEKEKKSR